MDEHQLKAAFAAFLLESATPFEAALKLYPSDKDRGEACRIAFAWVNDPEVIVEKKRLEADRPNDKIPSKEAVIEQLWELVKNEKTTPKDRGMNARLIAEMLGYIKKSEDDENAGRMPSAPVYKVVTE